MPQASPDQPLFQPVEIVTIYGAGFGPASIAGLPLTSNRLAVASLTGDTRVLFDDTPSPWSTASKAS